MAKRSFSSFLEATGDVKFDRMLGDIKAKATAGRDFEERVHGTMADVKDAIKVQHDLEVWLHGELEKVRQVPTRALSRFARELKPVADGYREDTNPLELLYFHATNKDPHGRHVTDDEDLEDVADAFLDRHLDDVEDACTAWLSAFDRLKTESDKKPWPIKQWRSVSKFDAELHHAQAICDSLKHWFK